MIKNLENGKSLDSMDCIDRLYLLCDRIKETNKVIGSAAGNSCDLSEKASDIQRVNAYLFVNKQSCINVMSAYICEAVEECLELLNSLSCDLRDVIFSESEEDLSSESISEEVSINI